MSINPNSDNSNLNKDFNDTSLFPVHNTPSAEADQETYDDSAKHENKNRAKRKHSTSKHTSRNKKPFSFTLAMFLLTIVVLFASYFAARIAILNGAKHLTESFHNAYDTAFNDTKTKLSDQIYDIFETQNHVSNVQSISVGEVKKKADLEVLRVSDVVYEIEQKNDNKFHITRWIEVPGTCIYTVNLKASEFIVDNIRNAITIRIPRIVSRTVVNGNDVKELFRKNDSDILQQFSKAEMTKAENDIVSKQMQNAHTDLRNQFQSNAAYEKQAREAAETTIAKLIKNLNPDNPDLQIFVEFME